jgi:hypothetical protein
VTGLAASKADYRLQATGYSIQGVQYEVGNIAQSFVSGVGTVFP